MEKPFFSVVIPTYNHEVFLEKAVKSVLNQTYKEFELIIVNDGASDNTVKKIEPFLKDKRIKYHDTGKIGKVKAFNFGFKWLKIFFAFSL